MAFKDSPATSSEGNFFITRNNFVLGAPFNYESYKTLLFFFDKEDLVSRQNTDMGFKNMRKELKILLRMLCYIAHCCDKAKVQLVYLEPHLTADTCKALTPPLRCVLTSEFCLMVTVPTASCLLNTQSLQFSDDMEAEEWDLDHTLRAMVSAAKRLICVDANLIGPTAAFVMRDDKAKTAELLDLFDFERWTYAPDIMSKKLKGIRLLVDKPLQCTDTSITQNSLNAAVTKYFSSESHDVLSLHTDEILEFVFTNMTVPEKNHTYKKFKATYPKSPYINFIEEIAKGTNPPSAEGLIVFSYSLEHLINKDNFNLFESAPFLKYPSLRSGGGSMNIADYATAMVATQGLASLEDQHEEDKEDGDFKTVWPHLYTFKKIAAQVQPVNRSPLEVLEVQVKLFHNTVLRNAEKIATDPAKGIFTAIKRTLLHKGGPAAFASQNATKLSCLQHTGDPTMLPRLGDHRMLHTVMCKIFGLGRTVQAFLTIIHIMHTTSPKWKSNRVMLVNHTRGGTGKTHTMEAIKTLFSNIHNLFSGFSSFTDTVMKYSEINVGKVMVMDDVGLSQNQQKSAQREDALFAAQFKSLLDNGYTINQCTEKDQKTNAFKVATKIMVCNVAFLWNTNTMATFSGAFMDRCFVLGSEPLSGGALVSRPSTQVIQDLEKMHIKKRFMWGFLRQHLIQTLLYTVCTADTIPSARAHAFVRDMVNHLASRFPVTRSTSSFFRSEFKLMDMIMGETIRIATIATFEYWIPPWTICPAILPDETCHSYSIRLEDARVKAFMMVDLAEVLVETMAQMKLFTPSSCTELVGITFGQATTGVFDAVFRLMVKAMSYNAREIFSKTDTPDGPALVINYADRICPELFLVDKALLSSGQDLWFKRSDSATVKLVEEVTATTIKLNGFFAFELLKLYGTHLFKEAYNHFYDIFTEQLIVDKRLTCITWAGTPPVSNFLLFWSIVNPVSDTGQPEVIVSDESGGVFCVGPNFMGIGADLYYASDNPRDDRPYGAFAGTMYRKGGSSTIMAHSLFTPDGTPPVSTLYEPQIQWFSIEYLKNNLAGFTHSPCGVIPSGDRCDFFAGTTPTDGSITWEYEEAHALYCKYLCDGSVRTIANTVKDLSRYIGFSNPPGSLAKDDPYLCSLTVSMPRTIDEALEVLGTRYNKDMNTIKTSYQARKRKAAQEDALNDPVMPPLKAMLSTAGRQLLMHMRQSSSPSNRVV